MRHTRFYLFDRHKQAYALWRRLGVRNACLVHVDAHLDLGIPNRLIDDSNFLFFAVRQGMINDLWWVIPGKRRAGSFAAARGHLEILAAEYSSLGQKLPLQRLRICTLDELPVFGKPVLLDIDTDFLLIDDLRKAECTCSIGQRKPWISPVDLADELARKVKRPLCTTIAYSVHGGFTPVEFKFLGDELAWRLSGGTLPRDIGAYRSASGHFNAFRRSRRADDYRRAACFDPLYRSRFNNYGELYLVAGQLAKAEKEFAMIARADPGHVFSLTGLGNIALIRKRYAKALGWFNLALSIDRKYPAALRGALAASVRLGRKRGARLLAGRVLKQFAAVRRQMV